MSMNKSTECQSIFKAARELREYTINIATTTDRDVQACNIMNTCVANTCRRKLYQQQNNQYSTLYESSAR